MRADLWLSTTLRIGQNARRPGILDAAVARSQRRAALPAELSCATGKRPDHKGQTTTNRRWCTIRIPALEPPTDDSSGLSRIDERLAYVRLAGRFLERIADLVS